MNPTKAQVEWVKARLPKFGWRAVDDVLDLVPRAYCVAMPASGLAVLATPQNDYRAHIAKSKENKFYSAQSIESLFWQQCLQVELGSWYTVAYCRYSASQSAGWFLLNMIPLARLKK